MPTPQKIRSKDRRTKAPKEDRMAVCRVHRTNKSQGREKEDSLGEPERERGVRCGRGMIMMVARFQIWRLICEQQANGIVFCPERFGVIHDIGNESWLPLCFKLMVYGVALTIQLCSWRQSSACWLSRRLQSGQISPPVLWCHQTPLCGSQSEFFGVVSKREHK
jgi:hypothetical protein